jgi:hypothetical protein
LAAAALISGCGGSDKKPAKPTPTPAETRSPAVAEGKAEGDLAVGLTEPNPNLVWAPGAHDGIPAEFTRWQDDVSKLQPSFFRIVLDWPSLQPKRGTPPNLELPADGCMRSQPPCAAWAGVKDQLAALASRQKQHKGGWQVLMVVTGTPDWAARPASGCERRGALPRSRAPQPSAMADYRKLVEDVIALGGRVGVKLRYWSAWNEPNHPYFISPQRSACDPAAPDVAAERYTELVRNLERALDEAPGDQEYVLGELAGLDESKETSTSLQEFLRKLPTSVVCGSTILSQHGYITGINPVDLAIRAAESHHCPKKHVVWMTETGVGAPHAGEDRRTTAPAERRACRKLHRRLVRWYTDPRVTAAFQYTFREDDVFRTGLVTTALDRAFPVLREWQEWGGVKRPQPTDPPPSHADCSRS